MNVADICAVDSTRRVDIPPNASLDSAGELAFEIVARGVDSSEPLLIIPNVGPATYDGALAIVDALSLASSPTIGLAYGVVANTGCLIWLACRTRVMSRFGELHLAPPSNEVRVDLPRGAFVSADIAPQIEAGLQRASARHDTFVDMLQRQTGMPRTAAVELLRMPRTLSAERCLALGIVSELI